MRFQPRNRQESPFRIPYKTNLKLLTPPQKSSRVLEALLNGLKMVKWNFVCIWKHLFMRKDMESSASDNIRAIWAYTLELLQTSEKQIGNHPGVLIFDEPTQHSIGSEDTKAFFEIL